MLDGEKCCRCRQKFKFEDLRPTPHAFSICKACEAKIAPDTEAKRRCPVDGQEMVKRIVGDVVLLDKCTQCGGVWFDGEELRIFNDLIKEQAFQKALLAARFMW